MKDSYNSASRYYLSQFHDAQRQKIIDALLTGSDYTEDDISILSNMNQDKSRNSTINFEGDSKIGSSCWYDDELAFTEEGDDETEYDEVKISPIDLPRLIDNTDKKLNQECTNDNVHFNTDSDNIINDWVMIDAMKKRIADSRSKILIF